MKTKKERVNISKMGISKAFGRKENRNKKRGRKKAKIGRRKKN